MPIGVHDRVDQDAFLNRVRVPVVAGEVLEVPDNLSGFHIDGERRVRVELGWSGARYRIGIAVVTCYSRIWAWYCGADVIQSRVWIVATGRAPRRNVATLLERQPAPGGIFRCAWQGRRPDAPQFLSRFSVMRDNEAPGPPTARATADYFPFDHGGSARMCHPRFIIGRLGFPDKLPRSSVQRDDVRILTQEVDFVAVDGVTSMLASLLSERIFRDVLG